MDCKKDITLVVSSCDKYEDAWHPYFELLKKFWPEHPEKIFLITESKSFKSPNLNIEVCNYGDNCTWSERLYKTLKRIDTKYIIFSLEDFFLLDYVRQDIIEKCVNWMENDSDIVECRLHGSEYDGLVESEEYAPFRFAGSDTPYRLDTQVALWNREALMNFIDQSENPWQFEGDGTKRIKDVDKKFLWLYNPNPFDISADVFPYRIYQWFGYGIAWGHWLWNNKKWFKQNGIFNVKFSRLGSLSERAAQRRMKHLYSKKPGFFTKLIKPIWRQYIRFRKIRANVMVLGFKKGLSKSWRDK